MVYDDPRKGDKMTDVEILKNIKEKMESATEALAHKAEEHNWGRYIVLRQKEYDLICIKAAAFEAICREIAKEEENWWEN